MLAASLGKVGSVGEAAMAQPQILSRGKTHFPIPISVGMEFAEGAEALILPRAELSWEVRAPLAPTAEHVGT